MLQLQHQTQAQFLVRFRRRYRASEKEECARLSKWLDARIDAGDIIKADIDSAFGRDSAAVLNKFDTVGSAWGIVQGARGE